MSTVTQSSLGRLPTPEVKAQPTRLTLTRSGLDFAIPASIVDAGSPLEQALLAWTEEYQALPLDLRAPLPSLEELAKMDSVAKVRDVSNQKTFENLKADVLLQQQLLTLLVAIDAQAATKRAEILEAQQSASISLAAVIGNRDGLPPVASVATKNYDMQLSSISAFGSKRAIQDARAGKWLAHAKQQLYSFLEALTA